MAPGKFRLFRSFFLGKMRRRTRRRAFTLLPQGVHMKRVQNLTEGNILSTLMGFAMPVLAALFLQTMYGAADMMIVGRFSMLPRYRLFQREAGLCRPSPLPSWDLPWEQPFFWGGRLGRGSRRRPGAWWEPVSGFLL